MKFLGLISITLAAAPAVLATAYTPHRIGAGMMFQKRQTTGTCNIQLATSNGGRKVAIVLDSSGSMSSNDPSDLRITAGKALNNQLVPASGATGGKSADLVTVVDFDDSAAVIYPLGDPAGAGSSFDKIDSSGGTFIADGVTKATTELTKPGADPTSGRSGIVVLTDGEDSDTTRLIAAITAAGTAGIRVSFGFLAPSSSSFRADLLSAILKTGGSYASFETADSLQSWLFLVLSNGITAADNSATSGSQPLLSGITVAKLTGSQPVSFSYASQAGEKLVFTISSLSAQELSSELTDSSGSVVGSNKTARTRSSTISYDSASGGDLKLVVSATNSTSEGVFQVAVNSSLGISGCNLNTTTPGGNSTYPPGPQPNTSVTVSPPTHTPTQTGTYPPVVTAAAAKVGFPIVAAIFAALLL